MYRELHNAYGTTHRVMIYWYPCAISNVYGIETRLDKKNMKKKLYKL